MAYEAMSPFGISWGHLALPLLPLILIVAVALAVVRRRELRSPRVGLLIVAAVTAGMWTFFTVGAPIMVPVPQDPQGAECLVTAFGDKPERSVFWGDDCGRALARRLIVSAGPSLVMLGVTLAATVRGMRLSRGTPDRVPL